MNLMADGAQMAIRSCQRKPHPRRFGAWPAMAYGGGDVARGDPEGRAKLAHYSMYEQINSLEIYFSKSVLISPSFPVLTPTLPSFLIAVIKAPLKLPGLLAKSLTVG